MPDIQLAKYKIQEKIGSGGWGFVLKGQDKETGELVALKFMSEEKEKYKFRFRREIRTISRLSHQNIIRIIASGVHNNRIFFIMEFVDGEELGTFWRINDLQENPEEAMKIIRQVCQGLDFIHGNGIIHRDIKPSNIMVRRDQIVKIMDFGLAKNYLEDTKLTQTGDALGTTFYMSPEQILGRKVDKGTDLYSFGVLLYELFTGVRPFIGEDAIQIAFKHLREQPVAPRMIRPDLPVEIEKILLRLLEKDPSARFGSAGEVWQAFTDVEWSQPVSYPVDPTVSLEIKRKSVPPDGIYRPRFVGREKEFAQLRDIIDKTPSGQGGLVIVSGETGVGKSRFVNEACNYAKAKDMVFLTASCKEYSRVPYKIYNELLEAMIKTMTDDDLRTFETKLRDSIPDLARFFPALQDFLDESSTSSNPSRKVSKRSEGKDRIFNLFTSLSASFSARRPAVFFIDNLQWADDLDLELLTALIKNLFQTEGKADSKLLIIAACRQDEIDGRHPTSRFVKTMRRGEFVTRIGLNRLKRADVVEFIQSMLGSPRPLIPLANRVYQESQGNPFFIEELVYSLLEESVIRQTKSGWEVTAEAASISGHPLDVVQINIPSTIREVINRRLEQLDDDETRFLQTASAIGGPFEFNLIKAATKAEEEDILDILDNLLKARIICEQRTGSGYVFDFDHLKFREMIYDGIEPHRKKRIHNRIAEAVSNLYEHDLDPFVEILAHQYFRGGNYANALKYLQQAGEKSADHFSYRRAFDFFEKSGLCVESLSATAEETGESTAGYIQRKGDILYRQGDFLVMSGDLDKAAGMYLDGLNIFKSLENEERIAAYHAKSGTIHRMNHQYGDALKSFLKALDYYGKQSHFERIVTLFGNIGFCHLHSGNLEMAQKYFNLSLENLQDFHDF